MKNLFVVCLSFLLSFCDVERVDPNTSAVANLLSSYNNRTLVDLGIGKWGLNIPTTLNYDPTSSLRVTISTNLDCQEPDLIAFASYCTTLQDVTIGSCITQSNSSGEIKTAIIVMDRAFWKDPTVSNDMKIDAIAHEMGHCLGLKHSTVPSNIMYAFIDESLRPYNMEPQKQMLKDFYNKGVEPAIDFFNTIFGNRVYLPKLKMFYINPELVL